MRFAKWLSRSLLAAPLAFAPGCLNIAEFAASPVECPTLENAAGHRLEFESSGQAFLDHNSLHLPEAREVRRFGIVLADVSPLPDEFRPRHAAKGGVLVARLLDTSPLALGGLEPMDLILAIDGKTVARPGEVVTALESVPDGSPVRVLVRKPERTRPRLMKGDDEVLPEETGTIEATPHGALDDGEDLSIFVFHGYWTPCGVRWKGPLQICDYKDDSRAGLETGVTREVEWGFLFDLLRFERTEVALRGRAVSKQSKTKILWFIPVYSHAEGEAKE